MRDGAINPAGSRDYKLTGCPSVGACTFLGTASTMQCLAEALGLTLPGAALVPSTMRDCCSTPVRPAVRSWIWPKRASPPARS
jgi:dihydroxy-acid dehydratase